MEVFDDTFIPPGLGEVWTAGRECPRCEAPHLRPLGSLDESHWLCDSCGHCWRVEHGRLRAVDPLVCHGCTAHPKRECIARMAGEFPRFGPQPAVGADI